MQGLPIFLDVPNFSRIDLGEIALDMRIHKGNGILLFYPGTMLAPGHYEALLDAFYEAGFNVAAAHLPGHGLKSGIRGFTFNSLLASGLKAEKWLFDAGFKWVAVSGHSQGGILALAHAARSRNLSAALIIGAIYPDMPDAIKVTRFASLARWRESILHTLRFIARYAPGLPIPLLLYLPLRKIIAGKAEPLAIGHDKGRISYPAQFLLSLFEAKIPREVNCATALFSALDDALFTRELTREVFAELEAPAKEMIWLEAGGHAAPMNSYLANFIASKSAEICENLGLALAVRKN